MGTATKLGSEANQWRKKRVVAKEVDDQVKTTTKKRKLHRDLFEEQRRSEVSCFFGMNQKVSERNTYQGKVVPLLSPNAALRAAKIRIRFADTIVKAKDKKQELDKKKLIKNKSGDAMMMMMRIEKEKQVLVRREREEIARIEEAKAARLNLRRKEQRLALDKYEEEAKSNIEDNLASEKELVKLCGGSSQARIRWLKMFGLSLRVEKPELEEI